MAETILLPEQKITTNDQLMGFYLGGIAPPPFTLELGKTYKVIWDGNEFTSSAWDASAVMSDSVAVGNGSAFSFPSNEEPFIIAYTLDVEVLFVSLTDAEPTEHTVAVYQVGEESGGEEETASPIVLKDRTGTGIEYEDVEGVRVFDKDGNAYVFVPPAESEEKTVELDFSGGAMEITPSAGKLLSKVGIPVPGNLLPENIAKDVDIAGVVGTHEGGGGDIPFEFVLTKATLLDIYNSYGTDVINVTVDVPINAIITRVARNSYAGLSSSSSTKSTKYLSNASETFELEQQKGADYTITDNGSKITISASATIPSTSTQKYGIKGVLLTVGYTLPGIIQRNENGNVVLYGDSSVTTWPGLNQLGGLEYIDIVDLRETSITSLTTYSFMGCKKLKKIYFPPAVTNINYPLIESYADEPLVIDMSNHTKIPTLQYMSTRPTFYAKSGLQILVPASLYDEWIVKNNWPNYASSIVPV